MIVRSNPQRLAQSDLDKIDSCITSTPSAGEYKVKKVRLDSDAKTILITHSSVAES